MEPFLGRNRSPLRRGFWLGPGPIVVTIIATVALLAGWRMIAQPDGPSTFTKFDPVVEHSIDFAWANSPYSLNGTADEDSLLFLGDSRAPAGISLRVLRREGFRNVGILWRGFGQIEDLLRGAREFPPRRIVVCVNPVSLHVRTPLHMMRLLEMQRAQSLPQRIDTRLDDELDVMRQKLLRPLELNSLIQGTSSQTADPHRLAGLYADLMREELRAGREQNLVVLRETLTSMRDAGWSIAMVRLPADTRIEQIEDAGFPRENFAQLCADLGLPYLDMTGGGYATLDGTHLLGAEADRVTELLARWLRTLPSMAGE